MDQENSNSFWVGEGHQMTWPLVWPVSWTQAIGGSPILLLWWNVHPTMMEIAWRHSLEIEFIVTRLSGLDEELSLRMITSQARPCVYTTSIQGLYIYFEDLADVYRKLLTLSLPNTHLLSKSPCLLGCHLPIWNDLPFIQSHPVLSMWGPVSDCTPKLLRQLWSNIFKHKGKLEYLILIWRNKYSVLLLKGYTNHWMQLNRNSRNRVTDIWSIDFWQKCQGNSMQKGWSF